jgi:hypothetical protein
MAHFAKTDSNNVVQQVIVVNNDVLLDSEGNESEQLGIDFCKSLYGQDTTWIQTSYNGNMRVRYAGVGMSYDALNNVFITKQPFPSWTLNETTWDWQAPVALPDSIKPYEWNEDTQSWDLLPPPPQPFDSWTWSEESYTWQPPVDYPSDYDTVAYEWNEDNQTWDLVTA